jgi:hypothetical protein
MSVLSFLIIFLHRTLLKENQMDSRGVYLDIDCSYSYEYGSNTDIPEREMKIQRQYGPEFY